MVDSAIFQKEVRDVAEFLYVLLTDAVIARNAPALIVACNKQGNCAPLPCPTCRRPSLFTGVFALQMSQWQNLQS